MKMLNEVYEKHLIRKELPQEDKMMKINPVNLNTSLNKNTAFKANGSAASNLHVADADIKFSQDLTRTYAAATNPIESLGQKIYKVIKTFLFEPGLTDDYANVLDRNLYELI